MRTRVCVLSRVVTLLVAVVSVGVACGLVAAGTASALTIRVRPGETLTGIAAQYGTTVAALAAANGIRDPNSILAGSVLEVPGPPVAVERTPSSVTVEVGDTLWAIAERYGTTVRSLAAANGLSDPDKIFPGEVLKLGVARATARLPAALLAHPGRLAYLPYFVEAASAYGVSTSLLEAVCFWESGWQPSVVSLTGAFGMCQIEPWTATYIDDVLLPGSHLSVRTPVANIDMGAALLAQLLATTGGDRGRALAAYDQGPASVAQYGIFPSTSAYVRGVLALTATFATG